MSSGEATVGTRKRTCKLLKLVLPQSFTLKQILYTFPALGDTHLEQNHSKKARMVKVGINGLAVILQCQLTIDQQS